MKVIFIISFSILFASTVSAQVDTVYQFDSKLIANRIKEGRSQYCMFYQNKTSPKKAGTYIVDKAITFKTVNGIDAIEIIQKLYSSDSAGYNYVYSLVRRDNFNPIYHRTWRQRTGIEAYDFYVNKIVGSDSVANNSKKGFELLTTHPLLNWELDLETFSILPLKKDKTFAINFYHPGSPTKPMLNSYKVVGEENINGMEGVKIACWKLLIDYGPKQQATFFISKKTGEVIKLEEDFGSGVRYKVKLPSHVNVR
jgi:hypothetical protein